jgi:hypothetical protein
MAAFDAQRDGVLPDAFKTAPASLFSPEFPPCFYHVFLNYANLRISASLFFRIFFLDVCSRVRQVVLSMLSDHEKEICGRLRQFREILQITRERFALSVGITGARLQSYELARAPVRYGIFKAITNRFPLNPIWLGTGLGSPSLDEPFNDTVFCSVVSPKMLLSEAVSAIMKKAGPPGLLLLQPKVIQVLRLIAEIQTALPKAEVSQEFKESVSKLAACGPGVLVAMQDEYRRNQAQRDTVKSAILAASAKKKVQNRR